MEEFFAGRKFQFAVPDAFNHEGDIRNFMLVTDKHYKTLSIMYANNDCSCKDGWCKWENIPLAKAGLCLTEDILFSFLEKEYESYKSYMKTQGYDVEGFDKGTFKWL